MRRFQTCTCVLLLSAALAAPVSAKGFFSKLFGKSSTTAAGSVGADREQLMLVSAEDMDKAATEQYAQIIKEAGAAGTLNTDKAVYDRVQAVAKKLIAQTGAFREDALKWDWQVNVIKEDTVNAWCMPGGKIVVYTGIIDALQLTDGELAAVMGHEISHALKEHCREQASKQYIQQTGISVVTQVAGLSETGQAVLALGVQYGITLPFSRECETEADNMGTELMARAGYDPHDAISVWEKMNKLGSSPLPEILSTHPSNESRIKNLTGIAEKVDPLYKEAKR
ncbi:MAG TPA: peptidase M48, partial [Treponema sp.]|nr:peptidase M48 [Treponema sp.]